MKIPAHGFGMKSGMHDAGTTLAVAPGLSRPFVLAWLGMLLLVFVCLAVHGVGLYHFSPDEMMHIDISRGASIGEVLRFSRFDPHPPLGHLLRYYWIMASEDPAYVRSESLLFGIVTVLLFYRIGNRMDGTLAGLCAAAFAAFCPALLLQSYIARNYSFFTFFAALTLLAYLRWKETRSNDRLLPFALAGAAACLTHLSGVFTLATIGGYEVLRTRFHAETLRALIPLSLTYAGIGAGVLAVWYALLPMGIAPYVHHAHDLSGVRWEVGLHYLPRTIIFLISIPGHFNYFYKLVAIMAVLGFSAWRVPHARMPFCMLALGLLLGVSLRAANFYPFIDPRHVLWLLPFIATSCGLALAAAMRWLQRRLAVPLAAMALLTILAGWALYDPLPRFRQLYEYQITEPAWQSLVAYLSGLDAHSLIIAREADALLIDPRDGNPYRFMGEDAPLTTTVPYYHTRILFDPTFAHSAPYHDDLSFAMLREAQMRGDLEGVDTLVFVSSSWTMRLFSKYMQDWMLCPSLTKTIRQFPPDSMHRPLGEEVFRTTPVTVMTVPKRAFLEQVLPKNGRAGACTQ